MTTHTSPFIKQLVAHRGDMTRHPENTLLALSNALRLGAHIEFDLQMNASGDFIVIHDDNFRRTSGISAPVLTSRTEDMRLISVHQPNQYLHTFFPQPAPLLKDVLALLSSYPDAKAFVEIKEESLHFHGLDKTMKPLLEALAPYSAQCALISFDLNAVIYTQEHSDLATGWVVKKYRPKYKKMAQALQPDYLICNHRKIPANQSPWSGHWEWMLYDILDYQKVLQYIKQGISLIETGDIEGIVHTLPHQAN